MVIYNGLRSFNKCITMCELTWPEIVAQRLKLLQDICFTTSQVPSCYRLCGVVKGHQISRGGEADVYAGTYGGKDNIVVRQFSSPSEGDWTTPEARAVIKVLSLLYQ